MLLPGTCAVNVGHILLQEADLQSEKSVDGAADVFIEATAGAQELIAIMKTLATSSEDRLRILEARDKLIRLGMPFVSEILSCSCFVCFWWWSDTAEQATVHTL